MNKFQLWSRDEYGQGSILFTSEKVEDVITEAKRRVTAANVENSLTGDDRERNWDSYFPMISSVNKKDSSKKHYLYGGRGALNKDVFYSVDKKSGEIKQISFEEIQQPKVEIYLGNISSSRKDEKDWFAKDVNKKPIEKLSHQELSDKVVLFVKVI